MGDVISIFNIAKEVKDELELEDIPLVKKIRLYLKESLLANGTPAGTTFHDIYKLIGNQTVIVEYDTHFLFTLPLLDLPDFINKRQPPMISITICGWLNDKQYGGFVLNICFSVENKVILFKQVTVSE